MASEDAKSGVLTQIIVAAAVALLVGGTAPWWWNEFFGRHDGIDRGEETGLRARVETIRGQLADLPPVPPPQELRALGRELEERLAAISGQREQAMRERERLMRFRNTDPDAVHAIRQQDEWLEDLQHQQSHVARQLREVEENLRIAHERQQLERELEELQSRMGPS